MRFLLISLLILNSALSFSQQAEFKFNEKVQRLGKVEEGSIKTTSFTFVNKGDAPLIIQDYKVACACTIVKFPDEPIPPGSEGIIQVSFDSEGKIGYQDRTITIYSNAAKSPHEIRITLTVLNE